MKITLDYSNKVWYPAVKADEIVKTIQLDELEWTYIVRKNNNIAYIEVFDEDGFLLGYV